MKLLTSLIVSVLVASSLAQFHFCPKDFCFKIRCGRIEDCNEKASHIPGSKFELVQGASVCGCCPMCVQILGEGDACVKEVKLGPGRVDLSVPRLSRCGDRLECEDGKCAKH